MKKLCSRLELVAMQLEIAQRRATCSPSKRDSCSRNVQCHVRRTASGFEAGGRDQLPGNQLQRGCCNQVVP